MLFRFLMSAGAVTIALLVGLISLKYLSKPLMIIFFMIVLSLTAEGMGLIFSHKNNLWIFSSYQPLNTILLILAAYKANKQISKNIAALAIISLIPVWCINIYYVGFKLMINWFNVYAFILVCVFYITVLFQMVSHSENDLYKQPLFWVCVGVIIYHGANIPVFSLINFLIVRNIKLAGTLYHIDHVLEFIYYSIIAVSFFMARQQAIAAKATG